MSDKCVVLLSGGIDSTVLLYYLVSYYECYPLTIAYGQRHTKELMAARNVCEARGGDLLKRWKMLDLSVLKHLLPSSLTGVGDIPESSYDDESMKSTVVPNRNMILLSIAAGYAQGIGAGYVAYGPHGGDHPLYPDCRPEFIQSVQRAMELGTGWEGEGVQLLTPFSKRTKAFVVRVGARMTVPFKMTWSCYKGGEVHCGVCGTCTERREAFKVAKVPDPTIYMAERLG